MNQIVALTGLMLTPLAFANPPVLLSGPTPALASSYDPNSSSTVVYTITNNVPQILGLTVGGISGPVSRTSVANDCGHYLPKGPSTCNLGITLAPTDSEAGLTVNQTLEIGYGARVPLTTDISFQVSPLKGYVTACGHYSASPKAAIPIQGTLINFTEIVSYVGILYTLGRCK